MNLFLMNFITSILIIWGVSLAIPQFELENLFFLYGILITLRYLVSVIKLRK